jgi:hypothetical protein
MRAKILSTLALSVILLGVGALHAQRVAVGVGIGVPAPVYGYAPMPVAPAAAYAPAYPAPAYGYTWVGGYYYPFGGRYVWHAGYWARPPYVGASWVGPRYVGRAYYGGYWRHR